MSGVSKRVFAFAVAGALAAAALAAALACAPDGAFHVPASVAPIPRDASAYQPGELIVCLDDAGAADTAAADDATRAIESTGLATAETLARSLADSGTVLLVSTENETCAGDDLAALTAFSQIGSPTSREVWSIVLTA